MLALLDLPMRGRDRGGGRMQDHASRIGSTQRVATSSFACRAPTSIISPQVHLPTPPIAPSSLHNAFNGSWKEDPQLCSESCLR